jgi:hypothetical protein
MDSRDYRDDRDIGMGGDEDDDSIEDMELVEDYIAAVFGSWESASGDGYFLDTMGL